MATSCGLNCCGVNLFGIRRNSFSTSDSPRILCTGRRRRISYERAMEAVHCSALDSMKFGPMVIKNPKKYALVLSPLPQDKFIQDIQNQITAYQFEIKLAKTCEEISEYLSNRIPNLIVIDTRTKLKRDWDPIILARSCQMAQKGFHHAVLVGLTEKSLLQERNSKTLKNAGIAQVFYSFSSFGDFLHLFDETIWHLQTKLKCSAGLFCALEQCDTAIEITDDSRNVQYVNTAYETLTGCSRMDVLGTFSSDLRRKSLPHRKLVPSKEIRKPHMSESGAEKTTSTKSLLDWHCSPVAGTSTTHPHEQFVYHKSDSVTDLQKPQGDQRRHHGQEFRLYQRRASQVPLAIETPVSEVLHLLRNAQQKSQEIKDEKLHETITDAMKILSSSELYTPIKTNFHEQDKVSADLFDGLVMNGPHRVSVQSRKMSLTDTMRDILGFKSRKSGPHHSMSPEIKEALDQDQEWNFSIFQLEKFTLRKPLTHLGMKLFEKWKVREYLQCSETCLQGWLDTIESYYRTENPYHNAVHAADVLQSTAFFLGQEPISNAIKHDDAVAALLAAVIHDVDHPGKGSPFLINTRHTLAILYNDVSVLESHHAAFAFQLTFGDPRINIFSRLSRDDYDSLRKRVVGMVLATDMTRHFDYLAEFKQNILSSEGCEEDSEVCPRETICAILIKCADINNPTRPWELCKRWAYRIVEEYFSQTAEELAKGLPLTMKVFDRDTCNVPLTQSRFIDVFARDLFQGWCKFGEFPELLENLENNYRKWQEEAMLWPEQRLKDMNEYGRISMESLTTVHPVHEVDTIPETPLLCGDS